ncbi:unnamed protein product, partial [marine sediment metagenome]
MSPERGYFPDLGISLFIEAIRSCDFLPEDRTHNRNVTPFDLNDTFRISPKQPEQESKQQETQDQPDKEVNHGRK